VLVSPKPAPEAPAPATPDICPTCGSETMRGFGKGESASYGVFVPCEAARCDRYVKELSAVMADAAVVGAAIPGAASPANQPSSFVTDKQPPGSAARLHP
jgi:hypothetical protein